MDNYREYSSKIIDVDGLQKSQEQEIFEAIRNGDSELKERLIASCKAKVTSIASEHVTSAVGFDELFTAGCAALIEAVRFFNSNKQERFCTYLDRCLRLRMKDCYNNLEGYLPIDRDIILLHDRYELALMELYPETKDRADPKVHHEGYIADYLGVTLERLRAMKNEYAMCKIVSLDSAVKIDESLSDDYEDDDIDNRSPLLEFLVDPASENDAAEYLDELMDCLSDDERYIVCARDGVLSADARTDAQIASRLGVDCNEIEDMYQVAIDKIRKGGNSES